MKKIFTLLMVSSFAMSAAFAQVETMSLDKKESELDAAKSELEAIEDKIASLEEEIAAMKPVDKWKYGGYFGIIANQTAFVNWAAGGENAISGTFIVGGFLNYAHNKHSWETTLDMSVGYNKLGSDGFQKNEDLISLNSKYGYKVQKHLFVTALMNFQSQFFVTEDFNDDSPGFANLSMFGAPAFLRLGLGLDYKPNDMFSLYLSPATGKFTFVQDAKDIDETRYGLTAGEIYRAEFGANLRAALKKEIVKNVDLNTTLDIFNNYTDPNKPNRKNFDVDWQTRITFGVNDWLSASLFVHLIYDNDIKSPIFDADGNPEPLINPDTGTPYLDGDGNPIQKKGPRTQVRQTFGLSLIFRRNSTD